MPIKVQCACGKAFAAKDELAGKTVKCPGCQKPLKIPGDGAPAKSPAKPASKPAAKQASASAGAKPSAPSSLGGMGNLFDEAGMQAAAKGTIPCPGCSEPLEPEVVVCIKCGYNMKLGRRMQTMKVGSEAGGNIGHGAVAQDLLDKAAQTMDEDAAAEATKTTEGLPWWAYLVLLILLIGLATFMLMFWGKEKPKDGEKAFLPNATPALVCRV